jgi:integration host factor subunit beta
VVVWKGLRFGENRGRPGNAVPFDLEFRGSLTAMTDAITMTKADLVEQVIQATDLPRKESETIVETIFESIIQALQTGDKIEIRGFGSFRTRQRRGRIGRNPKTGAKVDVPPKRIPFFKPSKELKDFVNGQLAPAASSGSSEAPSQGHS